MLEYSHVECTVSIKHMIRDSQHGDISAVSLLMTATLLGRSRNLTLQLLQFFCKAVDKITDSLENKESKIQPGVRAEDRYSKTWFDLSDWISSTSNFFLHFIVSLMERAWK